MLFSQPTTFSTSLSGVRPRQVNGLRCEFSGSASPSALEADLPYSSTGSVSSTSSLVLLVVLSRMSSTAPSDPGGGCRARSVSSRLGADFDSFARAPCSLIYFS